MFAVVTEVIMLIGKEAQVEFVEDEVCADLKEICEAEIFSRFRQILWFTYRSGFPRITNSKYESDVGWGCMLRTAQMILAECINRAMNFSCPKDQLISMFLDNEEAPLSIHRFVQLGMIHLGKQAGKWFGPSEASILAKYVCNFCAFHWLFLRFMNVQCIVDILLAIGKTGQ